MPWIDRTDATPEAGEFVLVWHETWQRVLTAVYIHEDDAFQADPQTWERIDHRVRYWQPEPERPTRAGSGGE